MGLEYANVSHVDIEVIDDGINRAAGSDVCVSFLRRVGMGDRGVFDRDREREEEDGQGYEDDRFIHEYTPMDIKDLVCLDSS